MSLYLGSIGRKIVNYTVMHPQSLPSYTANGCGKILSFIIGPHYKIGLTRLAHHISAQLTIGEKINITAGKIVKEDGAVIVQNKLLEVGKDMGTIQIREPFATPEGMANFLRHIYLNPARWGINVSEEFDRDQRSEFRNMIDDLNAALGIEPDNSLSLSIRLSQQKGVFTFEKFDLLLPFSYLVYKWYKWGKLVSLSDLGILSLAIILQKIITMKARGKSIKDGEYFPCFSRWNVLAGQKERAVIGVKQNGKLTSAMVVHEYIHFLKDFGAIANDIIAGSYQVLFERMIVRRMLDEAGISNYEALHKMKSSKDYAYGKKVDPYDFISTTKLFYPSIEKRITYKISYQLAGLAIQLAEKTNNPKSAKRFLYLVSQFRENRLLLKALQNDEEFGRFFVPASN